MEAGFSDRTLSVVVRLSHPDECRYSNPVWAAGPPVRRSGKACVLCSRDGSRAECGVTAAGTQREASMAVEFKFEQRGKVAAALWSVASYVLVN